MKIERCWWCDTRNILFMSASLHADCVNITDGENVCPKEEQICSCNCQYE